MTRATYQNENAREEQKAMASKLWYLFAQENWFHFSHRNRNSLSKGPLIGNVTDWLRVCPSKAGYDGGEHTYCLLVSCK